MKQLFTLVFLVIFLQTNAQERIDDSFSFQTDPAKKYSIFVPSNYDAATPNKMMLALHPLNTNRWDAISWCDTLIAFADANDLLMICPDGGLDGAVDDAIDTAFTSVVLDSMMTWYNVDEANVYAMGFSWGARTTYSYGLRNPNKFAGFLPIGAAIEGTNQVTGFLQNAADKPFYLVHGGNDSPASRFTPMLNALNDNGACVESILMPGIGHTIDFPNRNTILTTAFQWIENQVCGDVAPSAVANAEEVKGAISPNPVTIGGKVQLANWKNVSLYSAAQGWLKVEISNDTFSTSNLQSGVYFVTGELNGKRVTEKLLVF
ncbi:MAG: putative esterase [Saprospiraceae bacterium]|jgi:predicted esterase